MNKKDKEKTIELIKRCMIYRYSTQETLQHLESKKLKIAEGTLRRYKEEIKNEDKPSITEIAQQEIEEGLTHNIETMKQIQHECWRGYNSKHSTHRIKLLSLIKDSSVSLDKFYRSILSLEKMKKEAESAKQKLEKKLQHRL